MSEATAEEWCSLDIETATPQIGSICQIAVRVYDLSGEYLPTDSFSYKIRPPCNIYWDVFGKSRMASAEEKAARRRWSDVESHVAETLSGRRTVAHNAAFETAQIMKASERSGSAAPVKNGEMYCSLRAASVMFPNASSLSLGTLASELGLEYHRREAHDAYYDARVCGDIWRELGDRRDGGGPETAFALHDSIPDGEGGTWWRMFQMPPTSYQMRKLEEIAAETGADMPSPDSKGEASLAIDRLLAETDPPSENLADRVREAAASASRLLRCSPDDLVMVSDITEGLKEASLWTVDLPAEANGLGNLEMWLAAADTRKAEIAASMMEKFAAA